jgi:hypothetical protein
MNPPTHLGSEIKVHLVIGNNLSVRLYLQLFVGGFMTYLRCLRLFGPSLPPVVCRRADDLFTLLGKDRI